MPQLTGTVTSRPDWNAVEEWRKRQRPRPNKAQLLRAMYAAWARQVRKTNNLGPLPNSALCTFCFGHAWGDQEVKCPRCGKW